jgi:3-dehydroquinate dehydratase-2
MAGGGVAATKTILVLNGPNLNLLGSREPEIYGRETLADIEAACRKRAKALGLALDFRQSNAEAELIDWIQGARGTAAGIIINAAAYTHSSIAILDALAATDLSVVEVHLSNIFRREAFRHHSYVSRAASGVICGFGGFGYVLAVDAIARQIESKG